MLWVEYDECVWLIHTENTSYDYKIQMENISHVPTDSLLLVGYGRDHQRGSSRVFDVTMAKKGSWFTLYSATIWIKYVQIKINENFDLFGDVVFSVGANLNGN